MRVTNILLYLFLGFTVFLVGIHVQKVVHFENQPERLSDDIYSGKVIISTRLTAYDGRYRLNNSFHHIKTGIVIKNFAVQLSQRDKAQTYRLQPDSIEAYSGMDLEMIVFNRFAEIPDSLKILNTSDNPYFAFDYYFKSRANDLGDTFIAKVSADFTEGGESRTFTKNLTIVRKSTWEILPLDAHSDGSFLLIPVTGLITIILFIGKVIVMVNRKLRALENRV